MQNVITIADKFFNDVNSIKSDMKEIHGEIVNTIKRFLKAWKQLSQEMSKRELIDLWEESDMLIYDRDSGDPKFWLLEGAIINWNGRDTTVYLYLKRGDDTLYTNCEIPDITCSADKTKERYVLLDRFNLNHLMEIMNAIRGSLDQFFDNFLQKRISDSVSKIQTKKRKMLL